ncbi:MAG: hypothetical protein ABSG68_05880 [Thermoguttaceae bacterium]|jgi:hypothetical protein
MTKAVRKGLQSIRTRSSQASEADNPHRKFLRVANLELRKTLCNRVREAALRRVAEMDEQLADIAGQQAELLGLAQDPAGPHFAADAPPNRGSFTMKY